MIFLDTNVISETLRKAPNPLVIGRLATRNLSDFETTGLELIRTWDF